VLPDSAWVVLLLLTLIPGWVYLRLQERLRPPSNATGLSELLEVVAVGLATTGISALVIALLPHRWIPVIVDVDRWAIDGNAYLRDHIRIAIASVAIVLALALLIAYGLYRLQRRWLPDVRSQGNVWIHALGARPKGTVPWVGLELTNGKVVEGLLHSFSLNGTTDERDVALARPIRVIERAGEPAKDLGQLDRVIVPDRSIAHIAVVHVPER